jgi:hypothetical protein
MGETVDKFKQYQRRSFWIITLFMLAVAAGAGAGLFYALGRAATDFGPGPENERILETLVQVLTWGQAEFAGWVLPAMAGVLLVGGWILWLALRMGMASVFRDFKQLEPSRKPSATPGKKDFLDQKVEQERKHRLFLHTLSVLQREGRLLDFFDEDLKQYSDEQIGAAVRSIQADCKQAVKKYIDPRPVVNANEGETFTVAPGFDMNAITLVGNVTGEPPFEGIVRHPGWKAGKKEIPRLADIRDASVITPAEIEIKAGS